MLAVGEELDANQRGTPSFVVGWRVFVIGILILYKFNGYIWKQHSIVYVKNIKENDLSLYRELPPPLLPQTHNLKLLNVWGGGGGIANVPLGRLLYIMRPAKNH